MNIDTIYHSLLAKSYGEDTAVHLTELTEKYPYCQALHFAHLKWLKETNNVAFNDYLKLTAAYAGDREFLFSVIHEKKQAIEITAIPELAIPESVIPEPVIHVFVEDINHDLPEEPLHEKVADELVGSDEDRLQQIIDQRLRELNIVKSAPSPEFKIDDFLLQLEGQNVSVETNEIEEKQIIEETVIDELALVTEAIESKKDEKVPDEVLLPEEEPLSGETSKNEVTTDLAFDLVNNVSDDSEKESSNFNEATEEIEKLVQSDDPIDQLIGKHVLLEQLSPVIEEQEKKEQMPFNENRSFTEWLRSVKKQAGDGSRKATSEEPGDIIEKFIREEPRITPSRSAFYSPVNMAKQSILEHNDLVSETLAKIYGQQGNYEKAISAYEKLSLLHPEKSTFFAALIQELKQKQKL